MENINERVKLVRIEVGMNQADFGKKIAVAQNYLSNIERGYRDVTDKIIKIICFEFNVDEDWLRTGEGKMFSEQGTFSLDDYAKQKSLTALEKKIIKGYMDLSPETRDNLLETFKKVIQEENTLEEIAEEIVPNTEIKLNEEDKKELAKIKQEMLDEKKGKTSTASTALNVKRNA